jgi:hypothetical protein
MRGHGKPEILARELAKSIPARTTNIKRSSFVMPACAAGIPALLPLSSSNPAAGPVRY